MSHLSTPSRGLVMLCWICLGCLAASACGSECDVGSVRAALAFDRTARTFVEHFELAVLRSVTKDGQPVTCKDIPHKFPFGHDELRLVASESIDWNGRRDAHQLLPLEVPAGQPLIVAVQGMVPWSDGAHAVVRGCDDSLIYGPGESAEVRIDVEATVGRSCDNANNPCEPTLTSCLQGEHFAGGYCTILGCRDDRACPEGSRCVMGGSGNICARACSVTADDCETIGGQECLQRRGPGGCVQVCVNPLWSPSLACSVE